MKRRWIIRGFCIGLLLICVVCWICSYRFYVGVRYFHKPTVGSQSNDAIVLADGRIFVSQSEVMQMGAVRPFWGWEFIEGNTCDIDWQQQLAAVQVRRFWGFAVSWPAEDMLGGSTTVQVPLWGLSVIFTCLIALFWRRTPVGRAFPADLVAEKNQ